MAEYAGDLSPVIVCGLGRFGAAVAIALVRHGVEVLGVDSDDALANAMTGELTHVVVTDCSSEEALQQIGAGEFQRAVVGIGSNLEASILTTAALADLGVPAIWAKAVTLQHARILERVGAHHVVRPESDMGSRVARLVVGGVLDYLAVDAGLVVVRKGVPASLVGRSLAEADLSELLGVTVVGVRRAGAAGYDPPRADTRLMAGDVLVVAGGRDNVEGFAALD